MKKKKEIPEFNVILCASIYHLFVALTVVYARKIEKNTILILSTHEKSQYEHFVELAPKLRRAGMNFEVRLRNKKHELIGIEAIKDILGYRRMLSGKKKGFHFINFSWNFTGPFRTSIYLYKKADSAEFFEEGAMCVNTPKDRSLKKYLKRFMGIKETFYLDEKLISINVQKPELFPVYYKDKMRRLDISELVESLCLQDKNKILDIFLDSNELDVIAQIKEKKSSIVFTQPLSEDGYIEESRKKHIYEELCKIAGKYGEVILKIHPRDRTEYSRNNVSVLLKASYPSELLLIMPTKFENAIGICTSAVVGVRAENKVNLDNNYLNSLDDSFLNRFEGQIFSKERKDGKNNEKSGE